MPLAGKPLGRGWRSSTSVSIKNCRAAATPAAPDRKQMSSPLLNVCWQIWHYTLAGKLEQPLRRPTAECVCKCMRGEKSSHSGTRPAPATFTYKFKTKHTAHLVREPSAPNWPAEEEDHHHHQGVHHVCSALFASRFVQQPAQVHKWGAELPQQKASTCSCIRQEVSGHWV